MEDRDSIYLERALELSRSCVKSDSAYSVGAVLLCADGKVYGGYTHETNDTNHAEEEAILKASKDMATLEGAIMFCTMEPCSIRKSKPKSCTQLLIENRFKRVVFIVKEPDCFVECNGVNLLREAGIEVNINDELAESVRMINKHIIIS